MLIQHNIDFFPECFDLWSVVSLDIEYVAMEGWLYGPGYIYMFNLFPMRVVVYVYIPLPNLLIPK